MISLVDRERQGVEKVNYGEGGGGGGGDRTVRRRERIGGRDLYFLEEEERARNRAGIKGEKRGR